MAEGLDTVSTVVVNGLLLGTTDNMFRRYVWDVTDVVHSGSNTIAVQFQSAGAPVEARRCHVSANFTSEQKRMRRRWRRQRRTTSPRIARCGSMDCHTATSFVKHRYRHCSHATNNPHTRTRRDAEHLVRARCDGDRSATSVGIGARASSHRESGSRYRSAPTATLPSTTWSRRSARATCPRGQWRCGWRIKGMWWLRGEEIELKMRLTMARCMFGCTARGPM